MAPQYTIFIRNSAGTITANLTAMIGVKISRVLNGYDIAQTVITGTDPNVSYITYGAIVEIYRRDIAAGIPNQIEFAGVIYETKTTINEVTTITFIAVAGQNLLSALQQIQEIAGGDFAMIYTAPATFTFTWYTGQRGTDRSATVIFSTDTGTIGELIIDQPRVTDFNAVIVAGAGNESARAIVTRPAALPTGSDLREQWIDARNGQTTTAALQNTGNVALGLATRGRVTYSAKILQTPAVRYGVEYFIGDLVSLFTGATVVTQKINGVQISLDSMGREQIQIELITN